MQPARRDRRTRPPDDEPRSRRPGGVAHAGRGSPRTDVGRRRWLAAGARVARRCSCSLALVAVAVWLVFFSSVLAVARRPGRPAPACCPRPQIERAAARARRRAAGRASTSPRSRPGGGARRRSKSVEVSRGLAATRSAST